MFVEFKESLIRWKSTTNERQKLQHAYLVIIIVGTLVAGLVSLLDPERGHQLVRIAWVSLIAFLANALVWSIINSAVIARIPSGKSRK